MKVLCPVCLRGEIVNRICTRCKVALARHAETSEAKGRWSRGRGPDREVPSAIGDYVRTREDHREGE